MSEDLLNRRRFLHGASALGAALLWIGPGSRLAAADTAPIARRAYFDEPEYRNVRLSPSGTHIAWLAPVDGVRNLWVAPTDAPGAGRPVTRITTRSIGWSYAWAYNNRQLIYFEEQDGDENWRASSVDIGTGAVVPLSPPRGVRSFIQELDHKFPDEVLLRHNARDKRYFDMFRVNLVTGASTLLFENTGFAWLMTDANFRLRLGGRFARDGTCELFERTGRGAWRFVSSVPIAPAGMPSTPPPRRISAGSPRTDRATSSSSVDRSTTARSRFSTSATRQAANTPCSIGRAGASPSCSSNGARSPMPASGRCSRW